MRDHRQKKEKERLVLDDVPCSIMMHPSKSKTTIRVCYALNPVEMKTSLEKSLSVRRWRREIIARGIRKVIARDLNYSGAVCRDRDRARCGRVGRSRSRGRFSMQRSPSL